MTTWGELPVGGIGTQYGTRWRVVSDVRVECPNFGVLMPHVQVELLDAVGPLTLADGTHFDATPVGTLGLIAASELIATSEEEGVPF